MRGTGCSGGAFDFFEPLQNLDGYDVIETIARQSWVANHKVGMMGISYGGISQLFTAQTRPPSLAAISPLSVIDQTQTTLYPGGVLNTGFAVAWAQERVHDAEPASPNGGQPWAYQRVQQGDSTCAANQALHGEAVNLMAKIRANSHYVPAVADPLAPITFVGKINVPVYMACQWTDEQTGGHCPDLAEHFTATQRKWFTFTNGTHVDSLDPETLNRWCDFLQLYVARVPPLVGCAAVRAAAPLVYQQAVGINGITLPPDPIQQQPTYDSALGGVPGARADPGAVRQRCRRSAHPATRAPDLSTRSRASRSPERRRGTGTCRPTERWRRASRPARVMPASPGTRTPGRSPTSPATPRRGRTDCGRRCRPTTGWRRRRAAR